MRKNYLVITDTNAGFGSHEELKFFEDYNEAVKYYESHKNIYYRAIFKTEELKVNNG